MTRAIAITSLLAAAMTGSVVAQHAGATAEWTSASGELVHQAGTMARTPLETRVTRGQPYAAEAVTEFVQVLSDGNRIVRRTTMRLYRDSEGRTRRESLSGGPDERNMITITDPAAGVSFILDPDSKTAQKAPAMFAKISGGTVAAGPMAGSVTITRGPADDTRAADTSLMLEKVRELSTALAVMERGTAERRQTARESLGQQMVEGVMATGTRTTTTIPAGAIGNEQPISIVAEQWFSPELELLVLTKHSDPRSGETTYRLANLVRSEPDRALFQLPADYTMREFPRKPPIMWQQQ